MTFVCDCCLMCYEDGDAFGNCFCCFLSPIALLLISNLHAFRLQEHAYCPAKGCFLQHYFITFREKQRFYSKTICRLLLVCLLFFSRLKVFNCHFRSFILIKNRTNCGRFDSSRSASVNLKWRTWKDEVLIYALR